MGPTVKFSSNNYRTLSLQISSMLELVVFMAVRSMLVPCTRDANGRIACPATPGRYCAQPAWTANNPTRTEFASVRDFKTIIAFIV